MTITAFLRSYKVTSTRERKKIIISVTIVIENKSGTKENERKRDILIKDDLLRRTT